MNRPDSDLTVVSPTGTPSVQVANENNEGSVCFATTIIVPPMSVNGFVSSDTPRNPDIDAIIQVNLNWPEPARRPLLRVFRDWLTQGPCAVAGSVLMSLDRGRILRISPSTEEQVHYSSAYAIEEALRNAMFEAPILRLPAFRWRSHIRLVPPKVSVPPLTDEQKTELERAFAKA